MKNRARKQSRTTRSGKQSKESRRAALIVDARAGLIPASDDLWDEVRARISRTESIALTVEAYARTHKRSDSLAVLDILSDLQHYCEKKSIRFDELDVVAREQYQEESAQSRLVGYPG